ncbi:hypothetical protein ACOSQ2_007501 [Xanthoceras sorbifolium]
MTDVKVDGVRERCQARLFAFYRNRCEFFRNVSRGYSAIDLVTMCKRQKGDNMNFQYDFKMDGHNRLEHVAWSYASSVQLYEAFGDAVVFDTSHIWILMICSLAFGLD